jgi:signal transduction histidine kinase
MIMPYVQSEKTNNGAIITFNDITELKQTQSELNKKNQSLSRVNADLDHFIHAASHDLLAPLGNIEASIEMLNEPGISPKDSEDFLHIINASVKTFRTLITDISVIAKVESDMVKKEVVNLGELLDNIEWSLKDKIEGANVKIIRKLKVKNIQFSKKNMRSILFNLVANAIKFKSDLPPAITINSFKEKGYCIVTVEDNGRGIPAEARDKIFAMYGRLNQDIEGSGIGLYLAKKIIDAANGNIVVESEVGKGTKFSIYFAEEK